jgi:hypothetical protein
MHYWWLPSKLLFVYQLLFSCFILRQPAKTKLYPKLWRSQARFDPPPIFAPATSSVVLHSCACLHSPAWLQSCRLADSPRFARWQAWRCMHNIIHYKFEREEEGQFCSRTPPNFDFSCRTLLKHIFADGHYSKVKIYQWTLKVIKYSFFVLNAREIVCSVIFTLAKVSTCF